MKVQATAKYYNPGPLLSTFLALGVCRRPIQEKNKCQNTWIKSGKIDRTTDWLNITCSVVTAAEIDTFHPMALVATCLWKIEEHHIGKRPYFVTSIDSEYLCTVCGISRSLRKL
jgi:hypothetical protein